MDKKFLSLSTTEDDLMTDKDSVIKRALINRLENEINRLNGSEYEGLSPESFEQKNSLIHAMKASVKIIEMTWAKYHLGDKQLH